MFSIGLHVLQGFIYTIAIKPINKFLTRLSGILVDKCMGLNEIDIWTCLNTQGLSFNQRGGWLGRGQTVEQFEKQKGFEYRLI